MKRIEYIVKVNDLVDKMVFIYFAHFGDKDIDLVTCRDCCDYKLGLCFGCKVDDIVGCMYDKAVNSEVFANSEVFVNWV